MTLRDYLRIFQTRWKIILTCTAVGLLLGAGVAAAQPKQYTSQVTFFVSAHSADSGKAYDDSLLGQQKVATYLELMNEPRLAQEVSRRLGGAVSPTAVSDAISATSPSGTSLIRVDATDRTPEGAQRIAAGVADAFPALATTVEAESNPFPATTSIVIRQLQPPSISPAPVGPGTTVTLLLGLLLGLVVGVVGAVSRDRLDDSVRTTESLERAAGVPVLGRTGWDPSFSARPVIVGKDPASPLAEAFTAVRTHLGFATASSRCQVLVGIGPKLGAGTTSTLCNLAASLGRAGRRTVLVEADLRRPTMGSYLGLEDTRGLAAVLGGTADLEACIQPWHGGLIDVLLAGPVPDSAGDVLAPGRLGEVFEELRRRYDVVLVDVPPASTVTDAEIVAASADATLVIARCGRTTEAEVRRTVAGLAAAGTPLVGAVLTMVRLPGVRPAEAAPAADAASAGEPTGAGGRSDLPAWRAAVATWWDRAATGTRSVTTSILATMRPGIAPGEGADSSPAEASTPAASSPTVKLERKPHPRPGAAEDLNGGARRTASRSQSSGL